MSHITKKDLEKLEKISIELDKASKELKYELDVLMRLF